MTFQITSEDVDKRLDAFLAEKITDWSRAKLQKLIDEGEITVNEKNVKSSYKLHENDEIEADLIINDDERFEPENIPLDVIFEDETLIVINKPAGIIIHPGAGNQNGTLANALAYHFNLTDLTLENVDGELSRIEKIKSKIGIVHRLDKETSGLIVVAKNERAHENLAKQFRQREVYKSYIALAHGATRAEYGTIDAQITRDRTNRLRMAISKTGRTSLSLWKVRRRFERFTLLDVNIKTGRTHQIRVHLASIKHPVVGDEVYNGGRDKTIPDVKIRTAIAHLNRFFLHAERLNFKHPRTGEMMEFTAPLPKELLELLEVV
ncbi:MAG: RluA family pseudouridine synthase [Pyrinomonadaceae bacterium]|nr:RluA family pseudouridine synthase [Pyrinomonadaceae bacterium]